MLNVWAKGLSKNENGLNGVPMKFSKEDHIFKVRFCK